MTITQNSLIMIKKMLNSFLGVHLSILISSNFSFSCFGSHGTMVGVGGCTIGCCKLQLIIFALLKRSRIFSNVIFFLGENVYLEPHGAGHYWYGNNLIRQCPYPWFHFDLIFKFSGHELGRLGQVSMETCQKYIHLPVWIFRMYHGYLRSAPWYYREF